MHRSKQLCFSLAIKLYSLIFWGLSHEWDLRESQSGSGTSDIGFGFYPVRSGNRQFLTLASSGELNTASFLAKKPPKNPHSPLPVAKQDKSNLCLRSCMSSITDWMCWTLSCCSVVGLSVSSRGQDGWLHVCSSNNAPFCRSEVRPASALEEIVNVTEHLHENH